MSTKINPSVIMTDDNLSERNTFKKYFSSSKVILCTLHVLKAREQITCHSTKIFLEAFPGYFIYKELWETSVSKLLS